MLFGSTISLLTFCLLDLSITDRRVLKFLSIIVALFISPCNFLKINLFIYFWLRWVFVSERGLSLVAVRGGLPFVAVHGLLIAVASLVAEHGL